MDESALRAIERPHPRLMTYYALSCLLTGPLFPVFLLPAWFRYHTLRYRFEAEGLSMKWGILFRREILLNYSRIQDIHLRSNLVERWLGLARIQVQTASGSAEPEMTIEGLLEFDAVRDYLYSKMRGAHAATAGVQRAAAPPAASPAVPAEELAAVLREVCQEVRGLRQELERTRAAGEPPHV
jgi:putative membrane protein